MNDSPGHDIGTALLALGAERPGPDWERGGQVGVVARLFRTLYVSMFSPVQFFKQMRRTDGYLNPLIYAIALGSLSMIASIGWEVCFYSFGEGMLNPASSEQLVSLTPLIYSVTAILSPILVTMLVFLSSAVLHVLLLILGGAAHGFQTSFRVVCYSQGTGILNIVPFFGAFVGGLWNLVLLVIGLKESHETPTWKAATAVVIPLLIWTVFLMAVFLIMSGFGLP